MCSIEELLDELREIDLVVGVMKEDMKGAKETMAHIRSAIADKMLGGDCPVRSLTTDKAKVIIRNGAQKVKITNKDKLPDNVYKTKKTVDEPLVKAMLINGSVEGAELVTGSQTVSIEWRNHG